METVRIKPTARIDGKPAGNRHSDSPFGKMEAIALGVQAQLGDSTRFSRKVIEETVNTTRALGVNEAIIAQWTGQRSQRLVREAAGLREIGAILQRVRWDSSSGTLG